MWKSRLLETFAIVTIGDGVIEVLAPASTRCCGTPDRKAPAR